MTTTTDTTKQKPAVPPAPGRFVKSTIPQKALPPPESCVPTGRGFSLEKQPARPVQVPIQTDKPRSTNVVFTGSIMDLPKFVEKWQGMTNDQLKKTMGPNYNGENRVSMITTLTRQFMDTCRLTSLL